MKIFTIFATVLATVGVFNACGASASAAAGQLYQKSGGSGYGSSPTTSKTASGTSTPSAPLPSVTVTINGQNLVYPPLDHVPNTDDPIVQEWLKELNLDNIPNLPLSNGGQINFASAQCGPPTQILPNQGSWTCQKVVRPDDIVQCPGKGVWGLTYDDGPSLSTPQLLTTLDVYSLKATFFVVGSRVISYPQTLKTAYSKGHNIAVHTWSHPALCSITNAEIVAELKWTLKAIHDVLGITPLYMRPPYGDTDDRVRAVTRAVGLHTVIWTEGFDTDDWSLRPGGGSQDAQHVVNIFTGWMSNLTSMTHGFIVLEHDLFPQTVQAAMAVLKVATKQTGLSIQTVPACIGDNAPYLELGGKPPSVASTNNTGNTGNKSSTSNTNNSSGDSDPVVTAASTNGSGTVIIYDAMPIITIVISVILNSFL